MDEFHISAEKLHEMKVSLGQLAKAAEQAKKILNAFYGTLEPYQLSFFNTLEPYQRYELAHPKKKPRGSIRRKRHEREKNRNNCAGSTLYIDDIYDIVSNKDNQ